MNFIGGILAIASVSLIVFIVIHSYNNQTKSTIMQKDGGDQQPTTDPAGEAPKQDAGSVAADSQAQDAVNKTEGTANTDGDGKDQKAAEKETEA